MIAAGFLAAQVFVISAAGFFAAIHNMPATIKRSITISNDNVKEWKPEQRQVGGKSFLFFGVADYMFFKLCTGRSMAEEKKETQRGCMTEFMNNLIACRSDASQKQWKKFNLEHMMNANKERLSSGERPMKAQKCRQARAPDAVTCGEIVKVPMIHNGSHTVVNCLFGVGRESVWVEEDSDMINFVIDAISYDFSNGRSSQFRRWKKNTNDEAIGGNNEGDDDGNDDNQAGDNEDEAGTGQVHAGADQTDVDGSVRNASHDE